MTNEQFKNDQRIKKKLRTILLNVTFEINFRNACTLNIQNLIIHKNLKTKTTIQNIIFLKIYKMFSINYTIH